MPGMGTGVGGLDKKEAARIIVKAIKQTKFQNLEKILLIDVDDEMIEAFNDALGKFKSEKE
jgi:O-acetyl-ADP-ribose deacetylase (regulator of RNase III)